MTRLAMAALAASLAGCLGFEPVELHLCAPPELTATERSELQGASTWEAVVYFVRGESVYARRSFAGAAESPSLLLSAADAVPETEPIRIIVVGHAADASGGSRRVAVANSETVRLEGGDALCLCTAPPDRWGEVCLQRGCAYDAGAGCRF